MGEPGHPSPQSDVQDLHQEPQPEDDGRRDGNDPDEKEKKTNVITLALG